ncbi:uncharacterized protein L201_003714 [Kwoniella dendrophila CBS 6074]|uniref:Uncharacterized protein n=1 Tax=Kwoniella dendrophila CBS 6074 TaxID=1295534 RepID=A0AAX4JTP6_9TREE
MSNTSELQPISEKQNRNALRTKATATVDEIRTLYTPPTGHIYSVVDKRSSGIFFPIKASSLIEDYHKEDTTSQFREAAFQVMIDAVDAGTLKSKYAREWGKVSRQWGKSKTSGRTETEDTKNQFIKWSTKGHVIYPDLDTAFDTIAKLTNEGQDGYFELTDLGKRVMIHRAYVRTFDTIYDKPETIGNSDIPDMIKELSLIPSDIRSDMEQVWERKKLNLKYPNRELSPSEQETLDRIKSDGTYDIYKPSNLTNFINKDRQVVEAANTGDMFTRWAAKLS